MKFLFLPALATLALVALSADPGMAKNDKGCPPGLAKKAVPCVPPGHAKAWGAGDYVGDYDYHRIRYPDRYGLPPLGHGQRYLIVDGNILVVDEDTYTIVTVLRAVSAILD